MTLPASKTAHIARLYQAPPQIEDDTGKTWLTRGVNLVVALTDAASGASLKRDNPDEYMVILCPGHMAEISAGGEIITSTGPSLTIVPPGESRVTLPAGGRLVRIFSLEARDLTARAGNAGDYEGKVETDVAPYAAWPVPHDGYRLRTYSLESTEDADRPRMKPRIFRCTNLMVNVFHPWLTRRDPKEMSPHWHTDFEQVSLTLEGDFVHHVRYPWGSDSTQWVADNHIETASPSVLIIPPPAIHTTRDAGEGVTWLIDIFSPPRHDFSLKPGMVSNEEEYPLPADANQEVVKTSGALMDWQRSK